METEASLVQDGKEINYKEEVVQGLIKEEIDYEQYDQPETFDWYQEADPEQFAIKNETLDIKSERIEDECLEDFEDGETIPEEEDANDNFFHCNFCQFKSKYPGNLRKHRLIHLNIKHLKCDHCLYKTSRTDNLKKHIQRMHGGASEGAAKASKGAAKISKQFSCALCPFDTQHSHVLEQHMYTHGAPSLKKVYRCKDCTYESTKKDNFVKHAQTHLKQNKSYKCTLCNHRSTRKDNLRQHMATHKDPEELVMYKCDSCPFKSKYKKSLNKHVIIHKSEKEWYQCGICSYRTYTKYSLGPHMLIHFNEDGKKMRKLRWTTSKYAKKKQKTKFLCGYCEYSTEDEWQFDDHFKQHQNN